MAIDTSTITQDALSMIVQQYNYGKALALQIDDINYIFETPAININPTFLRNTLLKVRPDPEGTKTNKSFIYYDRIDLYAIINRPTVVKGSFTTVAAIIPMINDYFGINLASTDYVNQSLEGVSGELLIQATSSSLMFVGSLSINILAGSPSSISLFAPALNTSNAPIIENVVGTLIGISRPILTSIEGVAYELSTPTFVSFEGTLFPIGKPNVVSVRGTVFPIGQPSIASIEGTLFPLNQPNLVSIEGTLLALSTPTINSLEGTVSIVDIIPYFNNMVLRLESEQNAIFDTSPATRAARYNSGVTVSNDNPANGTGSLTNENTNGALVYASSPDFNLGDIFTVEFNIYRTPNSNGYLMAESGGNYMNFADGNITLFSSLGGVSGGVANIEQNTWTHIAFTRDNLGVFRAFKNGVIQFTSTNAASYSGASVPFAVYGIPDRGDLPSFRGKLDNIRMYKGVCLYNSNFTPVFAPVALTQTDPYFSNVVFLANFDTGFTDVKGKTITVTGTPAVNNVIPFDGGNSAKFDGVTPSSLTLAANSDFYFQEAFTYEGWFYRESGGASAVIIVDFGGVVNLNYQASSMYIDGVPNGRVYYHVNANESTGNTIVNGSSSNNSASVGTWAHYAMTWDGSTYRGFLNGELGFSIASTTPPYINTKGVLFGAYPNGAWNQNLSALLKGALGPQRITKGVSRYNASFTPLAEKRFAAVPDSFTPTIVNHFDGLNGATTFTDSRGKTSYAVVGASLSTAQSKFGTTSVRFNGTSSFSSTTLQDAVLIPTDLSYAFGTGDFTVEFFMKRDTTPTGLMVVCDFRPNTINGPYPCIYIKGNNKLAYYADTADRFADGLVTTTNWQHVALSRVSGVTRLFLDGQLSGSFNDNLNYTVGAFVTLGREADNPILLGFNGWIDELRINKGTGLYSAPFTPPIAAF